MRRKFMFQLIFISLLSFLFFYLSVNNTNNKKNKNAIYAVTTSTMVTDLIANIVKDKMNLSGLMGAGIDPHLYKASEGDVSKISNADIIFYNGLNLEGKMEEILEILKYKGVNVHSLGNSLDKTLLLSSDEFKSNYDPHVWFDIDLWILFTEFATEQLIEIDPQNSDFYKSNSLDYISKLKSLSNYVSKRVSEIPKERRVLITAHDAFGYFGQKYEFEVIGLQGISTASEAGVKDVQNLAQLIFDRKIKSIFIESSVPKRNIEALTQAVKSRGFSVTIGGELFSDSLGDPDKYEGTYIGMYKHNIDTIIDSLK